MQLDKLQPSRAKESAPVGLHLLLALNWFLVDALARIIHGGFNDQPKGASPRLWSQ